MENMPYKWLTSPVMLHSSRKHECTMTPEQCAFKYRRWVNWYVADLVKAVLPSTSLLPPSASSSRPTPRAWLTTLAAVRAFSYPDTHIFRWRSPSLGVCILLGCGFVYFSGVSLGAKPYYWPNTDTLSYGDSPPLATRSGYLSLACLPFIFAFGAKANLLTTITGVAPEKLIVFHLFAAWVMFNASAMWLAGVIALVAQAWLTFMSLPFVRHRAYEFFKFFHLFLAVAIFVVFLFIHVDYTLTSWDYIIAMGAIYCTSLL
ncbi:ferric reductase transmembrane [Ophiostoma piceae UAMH 11346]|uniref:Ferric reductase transmembrane n=1 Tax=Ophiostoma piceae (strain UAMH 11346) TaxID=1262450 RepID=S3C8F0_OPHP1|nr:ferric reductase transmembrane [Ophiostoma piceae UAMH 11346]